MGAWNRPNVLPVPHFSHAAGASAFVLEQPRPSGAVEVQQGSAGSGLRTRAGAPSRRHVDGRGVTAPLRNCACCARSDWRPSVGVCHDMPRLPRITSEATLRALRAAGWQQVRRRGSHVILHHASRPGRVTVPVHAGVILKPKTLLSILEQAGLSVEEFVNLL